MWLDTWGVLNWRLPLLFYSIGEISRSDQICENSFCMEKGQEHFVLSRLCVRCWCPKFQVGRVLRLRGLATHQWQVKGPSEEDYEKNSSKIRLISCGVWWELWLRKVLWKTCFIRRWENSALKTAESRTASLLGSSGLPTPSKKEEKFRMIRIKVLGRNWKLRKRISQMHCSAPFGDLIKYSELFPSPDGLNYIFISVKLMLVPSGLKLSSPPSNT